MIRITGGRLKGRLIKIPKGDKVRPTRSMVREAIFNIIGERISDAVVLDLFSGSGLLGLEAKSRGAKQVFFVEQDRMICRTLRENVSSLTPPHENPILCARARHALKQFHRAGIRFDIVLMDPPYQMDVTPILNTLATTAIVKAGGWIILERGKAWTPGVVPDDLIGVKEKVYGTSKIFIFQIVNPIPPESEA